jgi:anaerobic dimethyl sulfoxide reductase subunit C (anchor subunit)
MKSSEWALMFFTLFAQTAVGLLFTLFLVNNFTNWRNGFVNNKVINDKIVFLACAILVCALLISFFHLGNVKNAIYTLSNIFTSWLSREILCVIIFSVLTAVFLLISTKELCSQQTRNIVSLLSVINGFVLVFVMAKIYMLQNVPAWNSIFTPTSFYFSTFIIGGFTFVTAVVFIMQKQGSSLAVFPQMVGLVKLLAGIIFILLLVELIVWLLQVLMLSNGERAAVESYKLIVQNNLILFAARIILLFIGMSLVAIFYVSLSKGAFKTTYIYITYLIILIAEAIGRYLFYQMFARIGI